MAGNGNTESKETKKPRSENRNDPKLFLTLERIARKQESNRATLSVFTKIDHQFQKEDDAPLYFTDIQSLLLYTAFPQAHLNWPRWCRVLKPTKIEKTVVVLCDRITAEDVDCISEKSGIPFVPSFLKVNIDVPSPHSYSCLPEKELLSIPLQFLTAAARDRSMKHLSIKDGSCISENAMKSVDVEINKGTDDKLGSGVRNKDGDVSEEAAFPFVYNTERQKWGLSLWEQDRFPRTLLLLGPSQLSLENYPLPGERGTHTFLASHDVYDDVTDSSPMLSLDCEMVLTENQPPMELARVTLVNEAHEVIYDSLVKPQMPVINYLTPKSGITKKLLKNVTKTLKDVQMDMMEMLPKNVILIGQSLNCDLQALQMFHPYCIDTSVIYNLVGVRQRKPGLKLLTSKFLKRNIQTNNKKGHCSAEDAIAAMQLVQLKLQKTLEYGDATSGQWHNAELELTKEDDKEAEAPLAKRARVEAAEPVRLSSPGGPSSEGEDSPCNESCGKPEDEEVLSEALQRHRKFVSVHGTSPWCRPFFSLLTEAGLSCVLLDDEERAQASFPAEALESLTSLVVSRKDRRRVAAVSRALTDHRWTFVRLHQHVEREDSKAKRVERLRRYIEKIDEDLPPLSLLMVVVSGHPDRPKESARCYSGLKPRAQAKIPTEIPVDTTS